MVRCSVNAKFILREREEKEREGEGFYRTYVPALSVGNVLRVAPYDMFSGNDSSCSFFSAKLLYQAYVN